MLEISIVLVGRTVPGFKALIDAVAKEFKADISTATTEFPLTRAYRPARKQYDAAVLLSELKPYSSSRPALFVFREDLFADGLNFVFGLAKGNSCIVSTERLDPRFYGEKDLGKARSLFIERLIKEAIHEIGHAIGVPHCVEPSCVMVFSDSIEGVDRKKASFCPKCNGLKNRLI